MDLQYLRSERIFRREKNVEPGHRIALHDLVSAASEVSQCDAEFQPVMSCQCVFFMACGFTEALVSREQFLGDGSIEGCPPVQMVVREIGTAAPSFTCEDRA